MTPIELQLEGFTVYRKHTKVDWNGADTALFAVTGPTGAGKSTLLDAITYVLYGKTARLGGKGLGGLISPGAESLFAQLTFRTARGVYRATRVAQRRTSSVGTEVRIEVADPRGEGGWRQLAESDRVKDANAALEEIVGLDYDGFTRAVLLPQGAFDEFLRGDAGLRRQLLASLLGLDKVESIQRLAATKAAHLKGEADARRSLLANEYGDVGPEAISAIEQQIDELTAFVEKESAATSELEARLAGWRETAQLLAERARIVGKREQLQAAAQRIGELRGLAERARRAAAVVPHIERVGQAEKRAAAAEATVTTRRAELEAAEEHLKRVTAEAEGARAAGELEVGRLTAEIGALQEAAPLEAALTERGGSLAMAASASGKRVLDPQVWQSLSTAASLITPFDRAVAAEAAAARELEKLKEEVERLGKGVSAGRADLEARVESGKRLREAAAAAQDEVERARRADLAAAVREGLAPGDPCPVCGGKVGDHADDHGGADLTAATEAHAAATEALEAARSGYEAARTALARQETNLANAEERVKAAERSLAAAGAALEESVSDLAELGVAPQVAGAQAGSPVAAMAPRYPADAGRHLRSDLESRKAAALADHAAAVLERLAEADLAPQGGQSLTAMLAERRRKLEAARGRLQELEKSKDKAANDVELARTRLGAATENLQVYGHDLEEARKALQVAVDTAGFESATEASGAALPAPELQAMEAEVRTHEQEVTQTDRRDVELAAALADLAPLPDAPAALADQVKHAEHLTHMTEAELRERKGALQEHQQRLGAERLRLEQARERLKRSVEMRRELTALDAQHALHHQLNTDLHGHRFPEHLLTQVQQVLARRASSILQLVTDGRYDLRLEAGDYLVADAWAGGELRSARTLSGGESFVASLALALALSDTLAGSAALGALFLDEGFGTLDRATLEAVTGVLESLTNEGRMVGVITHVPELSARLPARLVVTKEPGGSTVAWDA